MDGEFLSKTRTFKTRILPHLLVILGFILVTMFFFSSAFFGGKELSQGDVLAFKGASKELVDYREANHEEALWTNSMFGGMPGYQISTTHNTNFIKLLEKPIRWIIPHPYVYLFIAFLCFYALMLIFGVSPLLAAAGALAFGFSSYNIQLYEAGHNTKIAAISYMPMVLGGLVLVFRKKYLLGGALFAFFLCLELGANHVQITYYLALLLLCIVVGFTVVAVKNREYAHLLRTSTSLFVAVLFALACNASLLWTTYEYKDHTIRGKSELSSENAKKESTSGLDKSYITQWSYGKSESFTFFVPNFKGGSTGQLKENRKALKQVNKKYRKTVQSMDKYFGGQPFTSGPVYFGATVFVLFVIGLFFYRETLKWSLIAASVLALFLSWGKNFMSFTDFFIEYVPLYNNFRAVSMTLVIVQLAVPILAVLGLHKLFNKVPTAQDQRKVWYAGGGMVFVLVVFMLFPSGVNSFFKPADPLLEQSVDEQERLTEELKGYEWPSGQIDNLLENLEAARKEVFLLDVQRSLMFVIVAWGLVLLFVYKKVQKVYIVAALLVVITGDLWSVDKRYLSKDNFHKKKKAELPFVESSADRFIKSQANKGRVLNLSVNTFNDASTSYLHQSIGGYSAVKLRRYQELFERSLNGEFNKIRTGLSSGNTENLFVGLHSLNMLNMKYVIYNPNAMPIENNEAYGEAWFAGATLLAKNADEELRLTLGLEGKNQVVISEKEKGNIRGFSYELDSASSINLVSYEPNELMYKTTSTKPSLVVFSEIFYKDGWEARIDGETVEIARANYVLRALEVPAGEHEIQFKFNPSSYYVGRKISGVSSTIILLLLLGLLYRRVKAKPINLEQ
ncbi:MAG: hypothetical protein ACJA0Q_000613 [Saprospiraceae bacterium]|jgi:hypothetical protein